MLIINAALYMLVVRPVKQMAEVADQLSLGNTAVAEFSTRGGHEVAMLGVSLNRMHKSLDKALKMLER
jgi:protein-histidine pros-kinase